MSGCELIATPATRFGGNCITSFSLGGVLAPEWSSMRALLLSSRTGNYVFVGAGCHDYLIQAVAVAGVGVQEHFDQAQTGIEVTTVMSRHHFES